jgi:hypothetical protein
MDLKGTKVTVHDMTLRDGMHPTPCVRIVVPFA